MEVTISMGGAAKGSRKLKNFKQALPRQTRRGFQKAGSIFERDMKQKLSGPSHTRNPGSGNPFPGVVTGRLRSGVNTQIDQTSGGLQLRVGPNVSYAPFLEFKKGAGRYPFVGPTLEHKGDKAIDAIQREIAKPLDRV